jgi:hypothetical protein
MVIYRIAPPATAIPKALLDEDLAMTDLMVKRHYEANKASSHGATSYYYSSKDTTQTPSLTRSSTPCPCPPPEASGYNFVQTGSSLSLSPASGFLNSYYLQ